MRISDWSSDVCSSDLDRQRGTSPQWIMLIQNPQFCRRAGRTWRPSQPTPFRDRRRPRPSRSEEHTSELQSLMRISYAVFCLKKKKNKTNQHTTIHTTNITESYTHVQ